MTITAKVYTVPTFAVSKQIFHVPGLMTPGGFTVGGVRISSPEPGGFGILEIEPAMLVNTVDQQVASWLMSKVNGEVLRVRMAATPQVANYLDFRGSTKWGAGGIYPDSNWDNGSPWSGDIALKYSASAAKGTNILQAETGSLGGIFRIGHVIGHNYDTYVIDEVYYSGTIAIMTVKPPLRRAVVAGDLVFIRPWFTGQITNGSEIVVPYDAEGNGAISVPKIVLSEVVL